MRKILIVIIVLAVLFPVALRLSRSATPVVDLSFPVNTIGQATPVAVHVRDPYGVRRLAAFIEQNGVRYRVWELAQPSRLPDSTWNFSAGANATPQLQAGKAKLVVEADLERLAREDNAL